MPETFIKVDMKVPIVVGLILVASISASFAVTQYQVTQLSDDMSDVEGEIKEIKEAISGLDVLNEQVRTLNKLVDRVDRRLSQVDELKIR